MIAIKETPMTNLLESFGSDKHEIKKEHHPNIKMNIKTAETRNTQNKNKRVVKTIKCQGRLANKGGKLVPEVVCSTDKVQVPSLKTNQNRDVY